MTEPPRPSRRQPLKYGLNPQQSDASLDFADGVEWLRALNGTLGYINVLDAAKAWQLARELGRAFERPAAASIKHVHPAGAALAGTADDAFRAAHLLAAGDWSPLATAYARARGGDRVASFGDFIGVSEVVDDSCARLIAREVSDGIVAPGYDAEALRVLRGKKGGRYIVLQADPDYEPPPLEVRSEAGITLRQGRNTAVIAPSLFARAVTTSPALSAEAVADLVLATIVARHAPSNAVCVAHAGQAIGIGGGQQARIYATDLACAKADLWRLQLHPRAAELTLPPDATRTARFNAVRQWLIWDRLDDADRARLRALADRLPAPLDTEERQEWVTRFAPVVLSSDGYIPFRDNVDRARRSGIHAIAQPGGSASDDAVTAAAAESGIAMVHTGLRLFWH
ncbi:MAG TPA: phosphoribosylaminoimidazolecarboxamide formyltransferase [Gemmatimonadaceae bacterium]|nr:phosphoribosylaminoimidazolecarboxamide formyltransferase [Gemmatimonadaceae bacterium]